MFKTIAVIAAIFIPLITLGYFLTLGIGKPIHSDLSVIGQGKPVLVLSYKNYSPASGEALNRLRQVRSVYDSRLDFVVADMGTPEGSKFTNRYNLFDGQAMFMTQDGHPLDVISVPEDEQELRTLLETKLLALQRNTK